MVRMVASAACVLPVADDDEDEFGMGPGQVFSTAFHPDMSMVAASYQDGSVRVYDLDVDPCKDGPDIAPMLHCIDPGTKLPTMAVRFRPEKSKSRNVLVSVDSSGSVQHWHLSSGKCLHEIVEDATHPLTQRQYRNQIFALQYSRDGEMFATAGKDKSIRIYEEATKSHVATLSQNIMGTSRGHSNCIFSVKWHPTDPNVLLSAGWDNTVCIWDKRAKTGAVRSIFGPHVAGDSLDIDPEGGATILTGSWRQEEQLQLWDYGSGQLISTLEWGGKGERASPCMIYAAQFSADGRRIAAGGSGQNELRVFDARTLRCIGTAGDLSGGVYSLDWAPTCNMITAGLSDGRCELFTVTPPTR